MTWSYAYTPQIWPPVFTVLVLIALAIYSFRRRSVPGALPFTFALLCGALWMVGSSLEVAAVDASAKIFWVKFQAVWLLPSATAVTCFLLDYACLAWALADPPQSGPAVHSMSACFWYDPYQRPPSPVLAKIHGRRIGDPAAWSGELDIPGLCLWAHHRESGRPGMVVHPLAAAPLARGAHVGWPDGWACW